MYSFMNWAVILFSPRQIVQLAEQQVHDAWAACYVFDATNWKQQVVQQAENKSTTSNLLNQWSLAVFLRNEVRVY